MVVPGPQLPLGESEGPSTEGLSSVLMLLFLLPTLGDLLVRVQLPLLSKEKWEKKKNQLEDTEREQDGEGQWGHVSNQHLPEADDCLGTCCGDVIEWGRVPGNTNRQDGRQHARKDKQNINIIAHCPLPPRLAVTPDVIYLL